ncbi:MAG: hypothetical protein RL660_500 [Bacteroidota bacterium]|jgi:hypothetical protein
MVKYLLCTTAAVFAALTSLAQWNTITTQNTAVCTNSAKQKDPRIIPDGSGGYYVAWKDWRNTGIPDIFVQRLNFAGVILWTAQGVAACTDPADQSTPNLVVDGRGGVIVSWSDWRTGIERDLYAQRLDSNGVIKWQVDGVVVANKTNREHNEKIIVDGQGGCYVTWEQQSGVQWDVWIQHLDSNGARTFGNGGMALCTSPANRINPKIQSDNTNGAIVVWQDERNGNYDIFAQRVDINGNRKWGTGGVAICVAADVQITPKIDPDRNIGGAYFSWIDKRNGADYDLFAQRVDSNGVIKWGTSGKAVVNAVANQSAHDMLSKSEFDGVIVTWKDARFGNEDVFAQKLDGNGDAKWGTVQNGVQVAVAANTQNNPNISYDSKGGCIIAWQDNRNISNGYDIYAQRLDSTGAARWANNGIIVCNAVGDQLGPKTTTDGDGGVTLVWEDNRDVLSNGIDVYGAHLDINGNMWTVDLPKAASIATLAVFPNPFTNSITIDCADLQSIELINVAGQQVFASRAGNKEVALPSSLPSGLYTCIAYTASGKKIAKLWKQ